MTRLIDLHNDVITMVNSSRFKKYVEGAARVGVEVILVSVWTAEMSDPMAKVRKFRILLDSIRDCNAENNTKPPKLLLHIEDAWFVTERNIDELLALKPFSVGLTWNGANPLASGSCADGPLTPLGGVVVKKLVENGVAVDFSHLNKQSFHDVSNLVLSQGERVFCTHACFDEINTHPRNLDRDQIQIIVNSGGLVGLTLVGDFLCGAKRATLHDVYNHIKYFIDNFGDDNIAVGTDFFGTNNLPTGLRKYKHFKRLEKYLVRRGISPETVDKIFYANARKFLTS